jgi:hypothetical protein
MPRSFPALVVALSAALMALLASVSLAAHPKRCAAVRTDLDGDCVPNSRDRDVDGDGIPNWRDRDMDGDGVANAADRDLDGDRIDNTKDRWPFGVRVPGSKTFGLRAPGRIAISTSTRVRLPRGVKVAPSFFGLADEQALALTSPSGSPAMRQVAWAGAGLLRQTFRWADIELRPGYWDFSAYDDFVLDAARNHVSLLPILFGPPSFRSGAPASGALKGTYPPASLADFADFAARLVRRYGPGGTLWAAHPDVAPQPITAWQVWNEPNLPVYWPTGPNPYAYTAMVKAVHAAVRAVDPHATIVTAGLPDSKLGMKPSSFLKKMYKAGARGNFEALAANPYATTADGVFEILRGLRRVMAGKHDKSPIWVTEIGWATAGGKAPFNLGKRGQSAMLAQTMPLLASHAKKLRLRGVVYYALRDLPVYAGGKDFWGLHTGLLDQRGLPKPALKLYRRVARGLRRSAR